MHGSDGRFIRQIGRKGAGPGEYEMIRNVLVAPDNSIRVVDALLGRVSVFSRSGEFAGSTKIPILGGFGMPAVLLADDQLVVNVHPHLRADAEFLVTLIDRQGKVVRRLDKVPGSNLRNPMLNERLLWKRSSGELLVANLFTFTIDVYTSGLVKSHSIKRVADWIPPREPASESEISDGRYDKPPTPQLRTIWEDAQGLLWLRMLVPSGVWRPGPSENQASRTTEEAHLAWLDKRLEQPRFETIIEVVDPHRQRVVTRSRLDRSIGTSLGGGWFTMAVTDSLQEPRVRISRVHLKQSLEDHAQLTDPAITYWVESCSSSRRLADSLNLPGIMGMAGAAGVQPPPPQIEAETDRARDED
jgi:hypothetical protein